MKKSPQRSATQIETELKKERKALYSKRSRLIKQRKEAKTQNLSEKKLLQIESKIDTTTTRIDKKTAKIFKYSDKYETLKNKKKSLESSLKATIRLRSNKSLTKEEKKQLDTRIRKRAEEIRDLGELMGRDLVIKQGQPSFVKDDKTKIQTWVEPFWKAKDILNSLYQPETYQTIDLEGEIVSLDSQLGFLFAVDIFIVETEANRFVAPARYMVAITADGNKGIITAERV